MRKRLTTNNDSGELGHVVDFEEGVVSDGVLVDGLETDNFFV